MLQGFYVMKAAEVSESRQRSQVHEQAAEQAAGVLVGVRLTTYTAPSRSLCKTKRGYSSQSKFSAAFKKQHQILPSDYRRNP